MSKPSVDMAKRMSSPLMVFLFSWWQRSLASDVMKLMNSLTHSCTHSLASFAIWVGAERTLANVQFVSGESAGSGDYFTIMHFLLAAADSSSKGSTLVFDSSDWPEKSQIWPLRNHFLEGDWSVHTAAFPLKSDISTFFWQLQFECVLAEWCEAHKL